MFERMVDIWLHTAKGSPQQIGSINLKIMTAESTLASVRRAKFCVKACAVYHDGGADHVKVFDQGSTMESYLKLNKVTGRVDSALAPLEEA